jgi:hypothetical protein
MRTSRPLLRRRELLSALGASAFLATPVFRQSLAEAQANGSPKRLILFHWPGGVPSRCYQLGQCQADERPTHAYFDFDGMLSSLAPLKSQTILFKKLRNAAAERSSYEGHQAGCVSMYTGHSTRTGTVTSVDQHVAKAVGNLTRFSSLQFCGTPHAIYSSDGTAYLDGFVLPAENDPFRMFEKLFGDGIVASAGQAAPDPAALARLERKKSILDYLKNEITAVQGITGSAEKPLLDLHLDSLRELEKRITQGATSATTECAAPNVAGVPSNRFQQALDDGDYSVVPQFAELQLDILYQAINCDLSRVATFQWSSSGEADLKFPWIPGYNENPDQHHSYQHDHEFPEIEAVFQGIQSWYVSMSAGLIARMNATAEGSGSLLANSAVVIASEFSNGNHTHSPIPVVIAGGGNGTFTKLGQTLDTGSNRSHNDLLLSLAGYMGANLSTIGEPQLCTGPIQL